MAHEFESGFFYKEPAWHGLGKTLNKVLTAAAAIKQAGLDWVAEKRPVFTKRKKGGGEIEVPHTFAVTRDTDEAVLGVVGKNYTPLQNVEAFGFFDPIVDKKQAIYHTAGSLRGGSRIWALAKLPNSVVLKAGGKEDITDKYVLLSNSHDGSSHVTMGITPIRVVCMNTLSAALAGLQLRFRIRHTSGVIDAVAEAAEKMGFVNKSYQKLEELYAHLAKVKLNEKTFKAYLDQIFPTKVELATAATAEELENEKKKRKGQRERAAWFYENGRGSDLPTARGTLWGAYNAVVELVDYGQKSKNRLQNVFYQADYGLKSKALQAAAALV